MSLTFEQPDQNVYLVLAGDQCNLCDHYMQPHVMASILCYLLHPQVSLELLRFHHGFFTIHTPDKKG